MEDYTIVLDEGTTSTRALVFDKKGMVISSARRSLKAIYPKPGWVEQSADEIYIKSVEAMEEAIEKCGFHPKRLGITNQRETIVVWDSKSGETLYNAIVWRDKRGQQLCEKLKADGYESPIRSKTGLLLDPYFSASKIRWLMDNVNEISSGVKKGTAKFGTVDSFLIWKLTGNHFIEASNASRTLLFNTSTFSWDQELLKVFGIPIDILPKVMPSAYTFGNSKYGEILGVLGDQQSALFGNECLSPGEAKCTYGTGAFVLANSGNLEISIPPGLLKTIAWRVSDKTTYALEGSILSSGENMTWLKSVGMIKEYDEIESLSRSVPSSEKLYFIPALDGLGAPRWVPNARGLFVGLSSFHTRAHIVRSVLDSMAFSVAEVIEAFKESGLSISKISVDGGGSQNSLLVQTLADATCVLAEIPKLHEMTAYGAFLMSGVGAGEWSIEDLKKRKNQSDSYTPKVDLTKEYKEWKLAEDFSVKWSQK